MEADLAQVPNNGASNSTDFQPTTQNPQNVPANLFQQQGGVQTVTNTQELLNDQQNVRIVVSKEPAPARPATAEANDSPLGFILLLVAFGAIILFLYVRRRRHQPQVIISYDDGVEATTEPTQAEVPETLKSETKPKAVKSKTSKKSKRRNR